MLLRLCSPIINLSSFSNLKIVTLGNLNWSDEKTRLCRTSLSVFVYSLNSLSNHMQALCSSVKITDYLNILLCGNLVSSNISTSSMRLFNLWNIGIDFFCNFIARSDAILILKIAFVFIYFYFDYYSYLKLIYAEWLIWFWG